MYICPICLNELIEINYNSFYADNDAINDDPHYSCSTSCWSPELGVNTHYFHLTPDHYTSSHLRIVLSMEIEEFGVHSYIKIISIDNNNKIIGDEIIALQDYNYCDSLIVINRILSLKWSL